MDQTDNGEKSINFYSIIEEEKLKVFEKLIKENKFIPKYIDLIKLLIKILKFIIFKQK